MNSETFKQCRETIDGNVLASCDTEDVAKHFLHITNFGDAFRIVSIVDIIKRGLQLPPPSYCDTDMPANEPTVWDSDRVATWLLDHGLGVLVDRFKKERICGAVLLKIDPKRLASALDISISTMAILTEAIKVLKDSKYDNDGNDDVVVVVDDDALRSNFIPDMFLLALTAIHSYTLKLK